MKIILPFIAAVGIAAGSSGDESHNGGSSVVISETTILNRLITSLNVFDSALVTLESGHDAVKNLKAVAADLAYTVDATTVLAHEIKSLNLQEAEGLKPKSAELHKAGGSFLKHLAAAKPKLESEHVSEHVFYYLDCRLGESRL